MIGTLGLIVFGFLEYYMINFKSRYYPEKQSFLVW